MRRIAPVVLPVLAIYWLTPVFAAIDFVFGHRIRVAFFDDNLMLRLGYYLLLIVLAVLMTRWPRTIRHLAPIEAGVNVMLTASGLILAYVGVAASVEAGTDPRVNLPLIPFLISVAAMILSQVARHVELRDVR